MSSEDLAAKVVRLQAEVDRLRERFDRLARLEAAGVDNWEGYSAAFRDEDDGDD